MKRVSVHFFNLNPEKCITSNVFLLHFQSLVRDCAFITSVAGFKAFIDLRNASMSVELEYQAKNILNRLYNAIWHWKGSAYHILCAVEMLLKHGNDGLLNELFMPKNIQELWKCFGSRKHYVPIETQQLLAKYVYVRHYMKIKNS